MTDPRSVPTETPTPAGIPAEVGADFRQAMRRLASGVALVTSAGAGDEPCGIAMTAVMSLTMEPPALLLAINQTASLCQPLLARGRFAVNLLAADQLALCQAFVTAPAAERFAGLDWHAEADGLPVVHGAVATILCRLDKAEPFGTHMVVRGLVERVILGSEAEPLAYVNGGYGRVAVDD